MTPNNMPKIGSPLGTVTRHRRVPCDVERSGGGPCCCVERVERVAAIRQPRKPFRTQSVGW